MREAGGPHSNKPVEIFISWSGKQGLQIAEAMRALLADVFANDVEMWISDVHIPKGARWNLELARAMDRCSFGLICVTRASCNSPWILFEAGAIAKAVDQSRVFPFLFDMHKSELTGPLAQFQATLPNRKDVGLLFQEINRGIERPKR